MSASMPAPVLLLFKGHPGVGKSTLARQVCQKLRWPLIDKDDARDCLQTLPAPVLQSFDANQLAYDIMFSYCRTQLSLGLSVALDCPFARVQLFDQATAVAEPFGALVAVIDCIADDEQVWQQRVEARGQQVTGSAAAHKPTTWQDVQELLQRYGDCWKWSLDSSRGIPHHLRVDTTASLGQQSTCERVLQFVHEIQQSSQQSLHLVVG